MKSKKITIKDVAQVAGVSPATVSQVLNGNVENFHKDTVSKILKVKEELNYSPNYFAQGMVKKQSKTIGVLVPDITNPFFSSLVSGIDHVLYKNDFITVLSNVGFDEKKEKKYIQELARRGVDGFVVASSTNAKISIVEQLNAENKPYVLLDHEDVDATCDAILVDDFDGGRLAGEHLYKLGHREVIVVAPHHPPENIQNRIYGFSSIFEGRLHVIYTDLSKEGGRNIAKEIIATKATAIFTINDDLAFGVYLGLEEAGKKVPDDYSVIGYDNVGMCEYVQPKLTTIAQPIFELGEKTAEMLLQRIKQPNRPIEQILLPVTLIKRKSTAPLN